MKYIFIVNPKAGKGKALKAAEKIEKLCKERNLYYEIHFTEGPNDATKIATNTLIPFNMEDFTPVVEEEPTTWEKIGQQFMGCLHGLGQVGEGLLVFFLGNSPVLIIFVVLPLGILLFFLRRARKKKQKASPPQQ